MKKTDPNSDSNNDRFREQPRAINFSISNRGEQRNQDGDTKSKDTDFENDTASASWFIPGHNTHYHQRSAALKLISPSKAVGGPAFLLLYLAILLL